MPNPMMQMLMGGAGRRASNPLAMLAEFRRFAAGMTPQRAQQEVQQLLQSGRMSQEQYQQLQARAKEFAQFLR